MLRFSAANAKTRELANSSVKDWLAGGRRVYALDLPAGSSCPLALYCKSEVKIVDGKKKIVDGKNIKYRCYATQAEALYPTVYKLRQSNFNELRNLKNAFVMAERILSDLPKDSGIIRIHTSGDFYCEHYFNAWTIATAMRPHILFYAYTKSLHFWTRYINEYGELPYNLVLTASRDGRLDNLIDEYKLRESKVIFDMKEADGPVDFTDEWAANPETRNTNFCLLLHNAQPAGTEAARAWQKIKSTKGGYKR